VPIIGKVPVHTFDDVAEIGNKVGSAVVDAAARAEEIQVDTMRGVVRLVEIAADDEDKDEIFSFAKMRKEGGELFVDTVVQAVTVGPLLLAGIPGELFAEIGMRLKQASPFQPAMLVGCANDYIGYIPTRANYLAGGYEVAMMSLQEKEGEIIEQAVLDLFSMLSHA
jgi:hypothetical protein